jgi:hypothetical protein
LIPSAANIYPLHQIILSLACVIANPFGPLEEPRFCAYLVKTWAAGQVPEVRTPLYVRDNIHVSLLAKPMRTSSPKQPDSRNPRTGRRPFMLKIKALSPSASRVSSNGAPPSPAP